MLWVNKNNILNNNCCALKSRHKDRAYVTDQNGSKFNVKIK